MSDKKKDSGKKPAASKKEPEAPSAPSRSRESQASSERRRFSRVTYFQNLILRNRVTGKVYEGGFNDISLFGMLFLSENLPVQDDEVEGEMKLGDVTLLLRGHVVRADPVKGAAIQFVNMDVESFSHLRRLVALNMGDSERIDQEFFRAL